MTTITVYTLESGMICGYEASGHASDRMLRGNENDLVCGAVSVLTVTGVNALESFLADMLVFLVAALPFIAIVAVVVIAVKIIRKRRK